MRCLCVAWASETSHMSGRTRRVSVPRARRQGATAAHGGRAGPERVRAWTQRWQGKCRLFPWQLGSQDILPVDEDDEHGIFGARSACDCDVNVLTVHRAIARRLYNVQDRRQLAHPAGPLLQRRPPAVAFRRSSSRPCARAAAKYRRGASGSLALLAERGCGESQEQETKRAHMRVRHRPNAGSSREIDLFCFCRQSIRATDLENAGIVNRDAGSKE